MDSQVSSLIYGEKSRSEVVHVSTGTLNETFRINDMGYVHVGIQPLLATQEERLLLDRYIYPDKGAAIAQQTEYALSVTEQVMSGRVVIPRILEYGTLDSGKSSDLLAYWVDGEVVGVNAKLDKSILGMTDYRTIIDWVIAMQTESREDEGSLGADYISRVEALQSLLNNDYYERALLKSDLPVLYRAADNVREWSEDILMDQGRVFKHGDLHVANILKAPDDSLAIIDFEASIGGPGDNLKDIMKLLHLDYIFFDVQKSHEGSFLSPSERKILLDYYVSNSRLTEVAKLREPKYLMKRIATDGLNRVIGRLTLSALRGHEPEGTRTRRLIRDMSSIVTEVEYYGGK